MKTTAIYPNRLADKQKLEATLGLPEFSVGGYMFMTKADELLSIDYRRIVYGDHGPYVEFDKDQIMWPILKCTRSGIGYYDKFYTSDGVLVYLQRATVAKLKNPPKDGKLGVVAGNRDEGYADYVPGMAYVDPYLVKVVLEAHI